MQRSFSRSSSHSLLPREGLGEETGGDNLGDIFSFDSIFCLGEEEEGSGDEDERERAVRRSS